MSLIGQNDMEAWLIDGFDTALNIISNLLTIMATSVALYVAYKQRKNIGRFARAVINLSLRTALSDLLLNAEKLRDIDISDSRQAKASRRILGEIKGQVQGNAFLPPEVRQEIEADIVRYVSNEPNDHDLSVLANKIKTQVRLLDTSVLVEDSEKH